MQALKAGLLAGSACRESSAEDGPRWLPLREHGYRRGAGGGPPRGFRAPASLRVLPTTSRGLPVNGPNDARGAYPSVDRRASGPAVA